MLQHKAFKQASASKCTAQGPRSHQLSSLTHSCTSTVTQRHGKCEHIVSKQMNQLKAFSHELSTSPLESLMRPRESTGGTVAGDLCFLPPAPPPLGWRAVCFHCGSVCLVTTAVSTLAYNSTHSIPQDNTCVRPRQMLVTDGTTQIGNPITISMLGITV